MIPIETSPEIPLPSLTKVPSRARRALLVVAAVGLGLHGLIEMASITLVAAPGFFHQEFAFEELSSQPAALAGVGVVFGLLRLLAAAGIFSNRLWGWVLGVLISTATFAMLTLYLPAGMTDAVFSGLVLACLLVARYSGERIL
jgi:uncharacterized membrane protein (DUF2068 family)